MWSQYSWTLCSQLGGWEGLETKARLRSFNVPSDMRKREEFLSRECCRTCICASMHSWHTKPRARARIVVSLTYHGTQSERKLKRARQSVLFLLDNYLFVAIFADSYYFKLFRSIISKAVFFIPITHDITLLTFAFCLITFVQLFVVPRERKYLTHRRHAQSQRA